jgi:hypothetical protein
VLLVRLEPRDQLIDEGTGLLVVKLGLGAREILERRSPQRPSFPGPSVSS